MCKKCEEMEEELNFHKEKTAELKREYQSVSESARFKKNIIELMEVNEGRYEEKIAILENQIHSNGKKFKLPKKPELDWNKKIEILQRHVPKYQWEEIIEDLEKLFAKWGLSRWKGIQKAYERKAKGGKQEPPPANVIAFPGGGGAQ